MTEVQPIPSTNTQVIRETVESLAVAFILALLFKAFIAEAFVIPTGSMAPTLMGAHKDIQCEECGYQYQCGASVEFNDVGIKNREIVVATTCPLCRKPQVADASKNANHATFSGDRILVSKLAYVWSEPRRWDVIVFKFIEQARQNYIKRCIGRPNETIRIREGNIYVQRNEKVLKGSDPVGQKPKGFEVARKQPHVMNAMLQILYDSKYLPKSLIKAGFPSPWQPFPATESAWQVSQTESKWSATIDKAPQDAMQWIRYYHRVVDPLAWESVNATGNLPNPIDPRSSRLISDFTAYNASYTATGGLVDRANFGSSARALISSGRTMDNDGIHWTGDLAVDVEVRTQPGTDSIAFLLVEAGVEHECRINLKTGVATATVSMDGVPLEAFQQPGDSRATRATADTPMRAGGRNRIRFANVDDTLVLWVDGSVMRWNPSGNMLTDSYLPLVARVPKTSPSNPLDAAPIAIGIQGGGAEILRTQVFRDIYYIAYISSGPSIMTDYPDVMGALRQSNTPQSLERYARDFYNKPAGELARVMSQESQGRNSILSDPDLWATSSMARSRRTTDYTMKDDWYFPMGDNSSASSDARSWQLHHCPERLMIGRAVMVFWPHWWNAPVPFLPNVQRMGLIR